MLLLSLLPRCCLAAFFLFATDADAAADALSAAFHAIIFLAIIY